jgi:serine/threonine protein kinase
MPDDSTEYMRTQLAAPSPEGDRVSAASVPDAASTPDAGVDVKDGVEPGDFIARYRIRERIGEGGMGVVYAAEDPDLGRVVAIKLLRSVPGSEGEVHQRRMLREAQALARVSHRNLVTVYDVGTHEGRVWIAMEYVVGETLDAWIAKGRRSWREIVDVFLGAGRGLAAVHAAGLVHRDFKPGNVLVGSQGTVQVLDFGLAARAGEPLPDDEGDKRARPDLDALAATLTTTGGIMGTPAYMAPEQFLRLGADARADQFGFCVALYEALYGHRPWKGRDLGELMVAVVGGLTQRPPALPGMPDEIRTVLIRGLRAEPAQRYVDMNALLEVLEKACSPVQRASGGWRTFALWMLIGGGGVALGARQWVVADDSPDSPSAETLVDSEHQGEPAEVVVTSAADASADDARSDGADDERARPAFSAEGETDEIDEIDVETDDDTGDELDNVLADLPSLNTLDDLLGEDTDTDGSSLGSLPAFVPDDPVDDPVDDSVADPVADTGIDEVQPKPVPAQRDRDAPRVERPSAPEVDADDSKIPRPDTQ